MVKIVTVLLLSFFVQKSFGQVDSSKIFLASKGTWKYPVRNRCILETDRPSDNYSKSLSFVCDSQAIVNAVFDGVVILIKQYDSVFILITKFENYFIGYTNLVGITVKKGDKLKAGNSIGYTGKDLDEIYRVDVTLQKEKEELDIASWFVNKITKPISQEQ